MGERGAKNQKAIKSKIKKATLTPSENLGPMAKIFFDTIVDSVHQDHFTFSDGPLLEMYCNALAVEVDCIEKLEEEGHVLLDKNGKSYKNPWAGILSDMQRNIQQIACKLRLSPSARYKNTQVKTKDTATASSKRAKLLD